MQDECNHQVIFFPLVFAYNSSVTMSFQIFTNKSNRTTMKLLVVIKPGSSLTRDKINDVNVLL